MRRGQAHMMEYILLTLFIVIIISILVFFLMGWQFTQLRARESRSESEKALYLMKFFIKSPFFTKDESLFDDAKLLAFAEMGEEGCKDLNVIFGRDWFARIYVLGGSGYICSSMSDYNAGCDTWSFCEQEDRRSFSYTLPVNVFRNREGRTVLGILEVGIYHEEGTD